jgi:hypothetical protein
MLTAHVVADQQISEVIVLNLDDPLFEYIGEHQFPEVGFGQITELLHERPVLWLLQGVYCIINGLGKLQHHWRMMFCRYEVCRCGFTGTLLTDDRNFFH